VWPKGFWPKGYWSNGFWPGLAAALVHYLGAGLRFSASLLAKISGGRSMEGQSLTQPAIEAVVEVANTLSGQVDVRPLLGTVRVVSTVEVKSIEIEP